MPRDITGDRYRDFIEQGLTAVRALSVGNAMTHMEGFLLEEGGLRFTDATLRPAGARIGPMLAFAYDIDPYLAWARVAVDGCFDGPWERKYAVGNGLSARDGDRTGGARERNRSREAVTSASSWLTFACRESARRSQPLTRATDTSPFAIRKRRSSKMPCS